MAKIKKTTGNRCKKCGEYGHYRDIQDPKDPLNNTALTTKQQQTYCSITYICIRCCEYHPTGYWTSWDEVVVGKANISKGTWDYSGV